MKATMVIFVWPAAFASIALAGSAIDGTWNLNVSKSNLAAGTLSWQEAADGMLTFSNGAQTFAYRANGQPFMTPRGDQVSVTRDSNGIYRIITSRKGSKVNDETIRVSADGSTLYLDGENSRPNGQVAPFHAVYRRTSSGIGILGDWQSVGKVKLSPAKLVIKNGAGDEVSLQYSGDAAPFQARWDGKDYPYRSPAAPAGLTRALTRLGTDGFQQITKVNGAVVEILRYRLQPDGSMIATETDGKGRAEGTFVWEK